MSLRFTTLLGVLLLACSALTLVGCGGEGKYTGQWEIDKDAFREALKEVMKEEGGENNPMAGFAMAMAESMSMTLDIKKDHTYSATVAMMGQNDTTTGTWKVQDGGIVMSTENGEAPGKLVLKGGKLHTIPDKNADQPPIVLKRKKA